jgi:hypothetical protein
MNSITTYTWDFDGNVIIDQGGEYSVTLTPEEVQELCSEARKHLVAQYPTLCAKNIIPIYTVNEYPSYVEVRNEKG